MKARGLLQDTLVVWTTEFGRMPMFQQGAQGRDHNPDGFTTWLAGAGVKRAFNEMGGNDTKGFIVAREVYKHLERIVDAFEDVANEIDGIVIDHA